jgi:hypothetical protein
MPFFNYKCTVCSCEYEELILGDETARCPNCDPDGELGIKQEKQVSSPAMFNGSLTDGKASMKERK